MDRGAGTKPRQPHARQPVMSARGNLFRIYEIRVRTFHSAHRFEPAQRQQFRDLYPKVRGARVFDCLHTAHRWGG